MATNLLDIAKGHFTDIAIAKAASFLGENNQSIYKAISYILPSLIGGMANKSENSDGVNELVQHLKASTKMDTSISLNKLMGGGTESQSLMSTGSPIVNSIFDKKTGQITDWIAKNTGIKTASATSIMNMVAPILMNLIAQRNGTSANSFVNLLNEQLPILRDENMPEELLKATNLDLSAAITTQVEDIVEERMDFSKFMPWVLLAIAILGGLYFFKTCSFEPSESETPQTVAETPAQTENTASTPTITTDSVHRITLPEGIVDIPKGSFLDKLYTDIVDSKADLTKPLTLDSVYFGNASARLRPESKKQVDKLVKIMKAFPNVDIKIVGHTDNFGIPDKNLRLSFIRAASVKRYLTLSGIDPIRITTEGLGDTKPIADNGTPEGMAKNRRIEVFITKK
jgi:OmpA-OmpF porin, OOP family